jgi:hypothetical protein
MIHKNVAGGDKRHFPGKSTVFLDSLKRLWECNTHRCLSLGGVSKVRSGRLNMGGVKRKRKAE